MEYYPYVYCSCYEGFQLLLDEKTCIDETGNTNELGSFIIKYKNILLPDKILNMGVLS